MPNTNGTARPEPGRAEPEEQRRAARVNLMRWYALSRMRSARADRPGTVSAVQRVALSGRVASASAARVPVYWMRAARKGRPGGR